MTAVLLFLVSDAAAAEPSTLLLPTKVPQTLLQLPPPGEGRWAGPATD